MCKIAGNSSTCTVKDPKDQNSIIAAAVVTSTVTTAVVFFLLGCAGGWLGHKYKGTTSTRAKSDKDANAEPVPLYDDLQPTSSTPEDQGKAFELRENVAYGPIRAK